MNAGILNLKIDYSKRVFGLDLYRAIAILLVVQMHGTGFLNDTVINNFPWFGMIDGVELFFVLSGFLIGTILLKKSSVKEKLKTKDLVSFWKRRWFRTLPNYYLILLVNVFIVNYKIINEDITQFNIKFFFFLQNFSQPFYGFFWESWSLSVEEWFYILFPIILSLCLYFFSPKKGFILAAAILIIFPLLYRMKISPGTYDPFWWEATFRKTVLARLDAIGYGIFAAWIKFYYPDFWKKNKYIFLTIGIALIVFVVNVRIDSNLFYSKTFGFCVTSIAAMLLLPFADQIKQAKGRIAKAITYISVISYSMYLLNLAVISEVITANFPPHSQPDAIAKYILYWIIVVLASALLYKYFEKPVMDLRDKKINIFRRAKKTNQT